MTKKNIWILLIVACIFVAIGAYTRIKQIEIHEAQSTAVAELFATTLSDASGQQHNLSQWRGKTLVVNFWATWCNPCVEEMPELSALQNSSNNKSLQIIGIGIDSAPNISEFSLKNKITYPLYVADTLGVELGRKFGNQAGGLPFTVIITPNGQIKKSYLGRLKLDELRKDLDLP
jgi:thiol-disulfide isomerase/thioredoxin